MFLIEVIPLARLPRMLPDTFSYFSAFPLKRGTIVEIEVKQRRLVGIVFTAESVKDAKQQLRSAPFMLKKIGRIISETSPFSTRDWEMLQWLSDQYLTAPANILRLLIPSYAYQAKNIAKWSSRLEPRESRKSSLRLIIGNDLIQEYRKDIESAIFRGEQILFITPDISRVVEIHEALSHKIPSESLLTVTSNERLSALRKHWHRVRDGSISVVIGSRLPLFFPFQNLGLIIFDDEGSPAHKSWDHQPRFHARDIVRKLHELHGGHLVIGGNPPSLEAYHWAHIEEPTNSVLNLPLLKVPPVSFFVEMDKEIKIAGEFVIISQILKDKLRTTLLEGGRTFLFVNRRGFAPFILCQDCGESFRCSQCSVPLVYHIQESLSEATLLCHHCGAKNPAPDRCTVCNSHRLKPYGIGVERIAKEVKLLFPGTPIITISGDSIKKPADSKKISARLASNSSYIAVGTEKALSGLHLPEVHLAAIISVDTALSLPDYLQNERLFRILSQIRARATKCFIFQNYSKEPELLRDLYHGTFEHFAEKELKERRRFGYPPYSELIKLTVRSSSRDEALRNVKELYRGLKFAKTKFPEESIEVTNPYPAYVEREKGLYIFHILIKILDKMQAHRIKSIINQYIAADVFIDVGPQSLL